MAALVPSVLAYLVVLAIGTGVFSNTEGWKPLDAMYFSAMTMKTIGFGDFVPSTLAGKFFNIVFAIGSPGVCAFTITVVGSKLLSVTDGRARRLMGGIIQNKEQFALLFLAVYMGVGAALFPVVEGGLSPMDGLQLSLAQVTTVGYGDVTPKTDAGKIAVVLYSFLGNGVAAIVIASIGDTLTDLLLSTKAKLS